jgi:hypothetical protein
MLTFLFGFFESRVSWIEEFRNSPEKFRLYMSKLLDGILRFGGFEDQINKKYE